MKTIVIMALLASLRDHTVWADFLIPAWAAVTAFCLYLAVFAFSERKPPARRRER